MNDPGQTAIQLADTDHRDFLTAATAVVAVAGIATTALPFIESLQPSADTLALAGPVDVDVSKMLVGEQLMVRWLDKPVFIVRRGSDALAELRAEAHTQRLRDPDSAEFQQPTYARNWHRSITPEFLVAVGICTHLGCVPGYRPIVGGAGLGADWPGGYFCACHASRYDLAGRVFKGVPAPFNLPVPPHWFPGEGLVRIGENPKGDEFDFKSIN